MSKEPRVVDVIGLRCPIPVHQTRMILNEMSSGDVLHLLGDDPESLHDIPALLERLGLPPAEISESDDCWLYVITNCEQ